MGIRCTIYDNLKRVLKWVALSGLIFILFRPVSAQEIAFLVSDSLTYSKRTIRGAQQLIEQSNQGATFHTFFVSPNDQQLIGLMDSVNQYHPKIIFTVGSRATEYAKNNFHDVPIVFSSVMYPIISGIVESVNNPGQNITGVSLNIRADIQFRYFKKIIPDLKKIGVLYTSNTAPLIPPAKVVAEAMELELVPIEIKNEKELPKALDSLAKSVDGLWSVADPYLFNPKSTKYILLNCLRKGLPFMGFSRYVVESGALFALDFDYKAIGRQAGKIVNKILDGVPAGQIGISPPDVVWFHYNENTATHLKVVIPDELAAVAKEVYR